jgi:predicted ATPase
MNSPFIRRITLRNYKSIAACRIDLPRLGFLVGRNGAGKSNVLDSISFVAESLLGSLGTAIEEDREGIDSMIRRTGDHFGPMAIRIDFTLSENSSGHFGFEVGKTHDGGFEVLHEECKVLGNTGEEHYYCVHSGVVTKASRPNFPVVLPDRLCLVAAGGFPEFRAVFDLLVRMAVYNPNPETLNRAQQGIGGVLQRSAKNMVQTLKNLEPEFRTKIDEFLTRALNTETSVEIKKSGELETINFLQAVTGQPGTTSFSPGSMSDGTLRALCILAVIFQTEYRNQPRHWLIGLEEPESAIHPAIASALLALLRQASQFNQILVTSHSPDLLDNTDIPPESIFAVDNVDGVTQIAGIDPAGRQMLRDKLFTPGELLRQNQIALDPAQLTEVRNETQLNLFEYGNP